MTSWLGAHAGQWWADVRAYGADGDGDDTDAVQAAIDENRVVLVPHTVSVERLTVSSQTRIVGTGWWSRANAPFGSAQWETGVDGAQLRFTATDGIALDVTDDVTFGGFAIEHLGLVGPGSGTATGLRLGAVGHVIGRLDDVLVANFSKAVDAVKWIDAETYGLRIRGANVGLHISGSSTNQNVWHQTEIQQTDTDALVVDGSILNKFYGGLIQNCSGTSGIRVLSPAGSVLLDGWWFEAITATNACYLAGGHGHALRDSYFASTAAELRVKANACRLERTRQTTSDAGVTIETGATDTIIESVEIDSGLYTDNGTRTIRR